MAQTVVRAVRDGYDYCKELIIEIHKFKLVIIHQLFVFTTKLILCTVNCF